MSSVQSPPEEGGGGHPRRRDGPSECRGCPPIVIGSNQRAPGGLRVAFGPGWAPGGLQVCEAKKVAQGQFMRYLFLKSQPRYLYL